MKNPFLQIAAICLAIAVVLGAFGAHTLKSMLPEAKLVSYETAVRYQFYHGFGLLVFGLLGSRLNKRLRTAGYLMFAGIFCFSGSIYLLALRDVLGIHFLTPILGPITPIGGVLFIISWVFLALEGKRLSNEL